MKFDSDRESSVAIEREPLNSQAFREDGEMLLYDVSSIED